MKKLVTIGLAAVVVVAMTAVAAAQYGQPAIVQLTGNVVPQKGGSKKKPRNARASLGFTVNRESNSTVSRFQLLMPRGIRLSGKGFRRCSATQINARGEFDADGDPTCPKGSKVGTGTATGLVGPLREPVTFTINLYAASRNEIAVALSGLTPIALRGQIDKAPPPYRQKVTVDVPQEVRQTPVGHVHLTGVEASIGKAKGRRIVVGRKKNGKKKRRKAYFASLIGCPKDRTHDFQVRLTMADNPTPPVERVVVAKDTSACSR